MTTNNNIDALFADAEIPFGHPGRRFDDTPEHFDHRDDRHEPPPVDPPEEGIVHYAPGDRPICGNESPYAVYTEEPDKVAGCREITATGSVEWRRVVRRPCPHCGRPGW